MPEPIATFPPSADVLQKAFGEETSRYTPHMEAVQVFNREARPIYFVSMRMTTKSIAYFDGLPLILVLAAVLAWKLLRGAVIDGRIFVAIAPMALATSILAGPTMNRLVAHRVSESRKPGDPAEAPAH